MSSSPVIAAIAALNNSGASCFQSGDLDSSLSLFRQALEAVATSLQPQLEAGGSLTSSSPPFASALTPPPPKEAAPLSSSPATAAKRSRDASVLLVAAAHPSEGGAGSIAQVTNAYTRPIHLSPHEGAYSPDPLVNAAMMSAILLFNVAVVFHVKGCGETSKESSERTYLERARDLYRKAHGLLQPGGEGPAHLFPTQHHQHPVLDVLSMALHNNIAAASYALGDYDACRTHVELLVASCSSVLSDAHRRLLDPEAVSVLEWHTHLFMYHAYFLRTPPTVASAA